MKDEWFSAEFPVVAEARGVVEESVEVLEGLRVLVVDDNPIDRQVLREVLRMWQCRPEEATDAWEALEKLRSAAGTVKEFDLALIDFRMPEMDGGQLAEEIKKDPRLALVPLLLLTAMPQHGDAARLMRMGFAAYLTKPIRQAVLREALLSLLGTRMKPGGHLSLVPPSPRRGAPATDTPDRGKGQESR